MRYYIVIFLQVSVLFLISACVPPQDSLEKTVRVQPASAQISYTNQSASHIAHMDTIFKEAYRAFEQKEYARSIELFKSHNDLDTALVNYESYAFIAECYRQLGQKEYATQVYDEAINKNSKRLKDINTEYISTLRTEELTEWKFNYPSFPAVLKKENGFRPYDTWPSATYKVEPRYPYRAVQERIEGTVYLKAVIDENGNVENVIVLKSDSKLLEVAAIKAVEQWKFSPYKKKGIPTKLEITVPITFRLPPEE